MVKSVHVVGDAVEKVAIAKLVTHFWHKVTNFTPVSI